FIHQKHLTNLFDEVIIIHMAATGNTVGYLLLTFEQGEAAAGMALAVLTVALTFIGLIAANHLQSATKPVRQPN
ncbi:hypothetical protein, partial [Lactiplantibacillus plantarum]|uniref:hypothetical protein n=1 Tax=Lactiplantibacillus plantarum TaxID=1590 RepID=UPI0027381B92